MKIIISSKNIEDYSKGFWSKVDIRSEKECWEWKNSIQSQGYGSVGIGTGKTALAHRVAYQLAFGEIPVGLCILHRCDNRRCVNPSHLFLGTIADNNRDMVVKGRNARGEKSGRAKLTMRQVEEMRAMYQERSCTFGDLAREYEITPSWARSIIKGDYWKLPQAE